MKKVTKKKLIFLVIAILWIALFSFGLLFFYQNYQKKELEKIQNIEKHYANIIQMNKNASLYKLSENNFEVIGSVKQDFIFKLVETKIENSNQNFFQISDTDFYVYFDDVKPYDEFQEEQYPEYYQIKKKVKTKDKTIFYEIDQEVLNLAKEMEFIAYFENEIYYFVSYQNQKVAIKKETTEIIEEFNLNEKATNINVFNFAKIDKNCSQNTCIKEEKLREYLNILKEKGFYTITDEEYELWLKGYLEVKPNAFLITMKDEFDFEKDFSFLKSTNNSFQFVDNNQTTNKGSKIEKLNRYQLNQNTTKEQLEKMLKGETVVIPKPSINNSVKKLPSLNAKASEIAVLNYHFFYDASSGEQCNEGNCLDVKEFRHQLNYLKENQYKTLTMEEYRAWMYKEIELPARSVLITVDDGAMGTGKHNGNKLIPILEEYQMNATLFLISGWWDKSNYISKFLDVESHTYNMHNGGSCSNQPRGAQMLCFNKEKVLEDLKKSIQVVGSSKAFCYPFYAYNNEAIENVKSVGFQLAFIGGSQKSNRNQNKFKITRYPIYKGISLNQFKNMIH